MTRGFTTPLKVLSLQSLLAGREDRGILIAQLGVLLDVFDKLYQSILVLLAIFEVVLGPKHFLGWLDGTQFDLALLVHHFHAGLGAWLALQKVQPSLVAGVGDNHQDGEHQERQYGLPNRRYVG